MPIMPSFLFPNWCQFFRGCEAVWRASELGKRAWPSGNFYKSKGCKFDCKVQFRRNALTATWTCPWRPCPVSVWSFRRTWCRWRWWWMRTRPLSRLRQDKRQSCTIWWTSSGPNLFTLKPFILLTCLSLVKSLEITIAKFKIIIIKWSILL